MSSDWTLTPLREAVNSEDGKRKPVRAADRKSGPYPYWGASGVVDWVDDYLFDYPTLLVSEDGENLKTRKTPIAFLASGRYWVNNHAHVLRAKEGFDLLFLAYAIENADISGFITGSTQPKLTAASLMNIPLLLPSLAEQRRIAGVLGALDDLIDVSRSITRDSVELAKALIANVHREQVVPLTTVATVSRGLSYKGSGLVAQGEGVPMVNMGSAANFGWLKRSGWKYYSGDYKERHVVLPNDILVMNTEQTWRNEILGWPLLVPADVPTAIFSHHVYKISMLRGWEWARLAVWGYLFDAQARAVIDGSVRGTTVANLPVDALERLSIPLPAPSDPVLVAVDLLLKTAWDAEVEVARLEATRKELLPLLMSGNVRVREVVAA